MNTPLRSTCLAGLLVLLCASLCAQSPFSHRVLHPDTAALFHLLSVDRIGPDLYRVTGNTTSPPGTPQFVRMEMYADGTISNGSMVPLDTNAGGFTPMLLHTSDGGMLSSYQWAADGTNKQVFVRTDAAGNVLWQRYYPDNFGLLLSGEQRMVEKDGHYFVFGRSQDVPSTEGWACALLEVDGSGAFAGLRHFAGGDLWSDIPQALIRTPSNGLVTVSTLRPYASQSTWPQIAIQRWNADLELEWSKTFSFGNYHLFTSANQLADGSLMITGSVRLSFAGDFLPIIFKVDTLGEVVWSRRTQGTMPLLTDALEEADGSLVAVGWDGHAVCARLDSAGALLSARVSGLTDWPDELVRDSASGETLVGCFNTAAVLRLDADLHFACDDQPTTWSDTLVAPSVVDFAITITDMVPLASFDSTITVQPLTFTSEDLCLSTADHQKPSRLGPRMRLVLTPNPARSSVSVTIPDDPQGSVLTISEVTGRQVRQLRVSSGRQDVDVSTLARGCYLLTVASQRGTLAQRLVVE